MTRAIWGGQPGTHAAQFFERPPVFHAMAGLFLEEAVSRGRPAVVVTPREMFDAAAAVVAARCGEEAASRLMFFDANVAVDSFLAGRDIDPRRVEEGYREMMRAIDAHGGDGPVWFFGHMSGLLATRGLPDASLQLETEWNILSAGRPFAVLCGYEARYLDAASAATRAGLCDAHTHLVPVDGIRTFPTVYVVDDDPSVRRSLARLLTSFDLRVRTFASGEAFLAQVDPAASGCLVVDVQLVGMSGADLQGRLAIARWQLPVITMSGSPDPQIEAAALRGGAAAFLRKPFPMTALLDAVMGVL